MQFAVCFLRLTECQNLAERDSCVSEITFTFAIVNWNTRALLQQCIESIYRERGDFAIQILVADNNSSDGSPQMLTEQFPKTRFPEITVVRNTDNIGFAGGHATLFPLGRGRYHVLLNSDVRLLPGCLERVAARMAADEKIGILGCRIIGPDDRIQPSCRRFPNLAYQLIEASGVNRFFPQHPRINAYKMGGFDHQRSREVDQVMGSFFLIRDRVIQEIGYLDCDFFMYYEEVDYCLRCHQAGYKIFFEAEASVWHEGGGSSKMVKVPTIRRTMRSMRHYFRKHRGGWTWFPLLFIVSLDTVTHFVHALVTRNRPILTLRAYLLGMWDFVTLRKAG